MQSKESNQAKFQGGSNHAGFVTQKDTTACVARYGALAAAIVRSVMQGVLDGALQGGGEGSCVVSPTGATGVRINPPA
jgi:hypothetical protein